MNNSHSVINDYPIDYNIFPLVQKSYMYKIEISNNQYISIPKYWFHWIITEPNTLSVNYKIDYMNFSDTDNDFYKSFTQSKPFIKKIIKNDITWNEFITNTLDFKYKSIISETKDCSPVKKNNTFKYFYENSLKNIIKSSKKYYTYIGNNEIDDKNILFSYKNIDYLINPNYYNKITYDTGVWFSLDKQIDSGLHNDPTFNIIYVLDGKKTIYLYGPDCKENLYIELFPLINKLKIIN